MTLTVEGLGDVLTIEAYRNLKDYSGIVYPIDPDKIVKETRPHTHWQNNGCGYADYGYHGCGRAWAALNDKIEIVALVYMEAGRCDDEKFSAYRQEAREQLAQFGEVISGMCSCYEFIRYH